MPEAYADTGAPEGYEYVWSSLWREVGRDDAAPIAINRPLFDHEREWVLAKAAEIAGGGGLELPERQRAYITALAAQIGGE